MLDNKDLCIGNWVQTINGYDKIIGVMNNSVYFVDGKWPLNDVEPITLTSDILKKIGFKNDGNNKMSIDVKAGIFKTEFVLNITNTISYSCNQGRLPLIRDFKYLHDLQNFFYFFWGHNLNIESLINAN